MTIRLGGDYYGCNFGIKCDPEQAILLREQYPQAVLPGYHMNKKHWNTLVAGQGLSEPLMLQAILHSYQLIRSSKPSK